MLINPRCNFPCSKHLVFITSTSLLFLLLAVFNGKLHAQSQKAYLTNVGDKSVYYAVAVNRKKTTSSKHSNIGEYIKPEIVTTAWTKLLPGKSVAIRTDNLISVRNNVLSPVEGTYYLPVIDGESTSISPVAGSVFPRSPGTRYILSLIHI